jgi:predicted dithiol-disulfide oxidoreductase (DUF899 family)
VLATIASARSVDRISTGTEKHITDRNIVSRQEWAAAREELLAREKEHTRLGDELARQRRELPWLRVDKDYRFDTDEGEEALDELFDGRGQLLAYHFMRGPRYQAGCPVSSSIADTVDDVLPHLHAPRIQRTAAAPTCGLSFPVRPSLRP